MHYDIAQIIVLVKDYDQAKDFYIHQLGFIEIEDTTLSNSKRWIQLKPNKNASVSIVLNKINNEAQIPFVGQQTGGKVIMVLHTNNIEADVAQLKQNKVEIHQDITELPHGKVALFKDLYGNVYDLVQPNK